MPRTRSGSERSTTKSLPWSMNALHGARRPGGQPFPQHGAPALRRRVRVLLGARERELLLDDLLGEHEPGVVVARGLDVGERAERVVTGPERAGEPLAARVEPHRRGPGNDPDRVHRPDRAPVVDALHVVPHAVAVDLARPGRAGDREHAAVHVGGDARQHSRGRLAQALGPLLAHEVVVAADAAAGGDHRLGAQLEVADLHAAALLAAPARARLEHLAAHAAHGAGGHGQLVDAVAEAQLHEPARRRPRARGARTGATTPGPVPQVM